MPADLILYALVAAGLVFWLRSVLGTRHGDERSRPNPFAQNPEQVSERSPVTERGENSDIAPAPVGVQELSLPRNASVAESADAGLDEIAGADRHFDLAHFVTGAQDAFVMIVEAFAKGERETLEGLLGERVYAAFDSALTQRTQSGESVSTEIHAVRKADIIEAHLDGRIAQITVQFTADETCVIRDSEGRIIAGNPDRITEMSDIWTFERDTRSKDPRWLVVETRDGHAEDHKTPVPDAS